MYRGLSSKEAKERLSKYGKNIFVKEEKHSVLKILFNQFKNPMIYLLIIASILSFYLSEYLEAYGIAIAIILTIVMGFYLEYKADRSLEKLKSFQKIKAIVIRDGKEKVIDAEFIVPGDLVFIQAGAMMPADGYVIKAHQLRVDESSLTGESKAISKKKGDKVYAGTYVMNGEAYIRIEKTGSSTYFGKLAKSLEEIEEKESLLSKASKELAKKISAVSLAIIILFIIFGYFFMPISFEELVIFAITLAVASVPEGLATAFTIILALGVQEMTKHNAIIKKLSSVEMLGKIDVLALDKTGTITSGESKLVYATKWVDKYGILCSSAKMDKGKYVGEDLDIALLKYSYEKYGKDIRQAYNYKKIVPFSSEKKYMKVIVEKNGEKISITKGALEALSKSYNINNRWLKKAESFYKKGMRVIGVAVNDKFKGLLVFADPIKDGVKETLEQCYKADIDVYVITGDNAIAASYIAKQAGVKGEVITWDKLSSYNDEELYQALKRYKIIARALPTNKLKIVEVMQKHGHVIGVSGDGINDAPALKKADVGVVMGKKGSEISKQVADIVLVDDNISTLIKAIAYGRNTFLNILNFIRFQFTTNFAALILTAIAFIAKNPLPLTPLQLLWINIIMDGPPALAQAFEKQRKEAIIGNPIKHLSSMLPKNLIKVILSNAFYMAIITFIIFNFYLAKGIGYALSASFNVFVLFQLFNAFNTHSLKDSAFSLHNKVLLVVIIVMLILQYFVNINTSLRSLFSIKVMSLNDYLIITIIALSIIVIEEIRKGLKIWIALE